MVATARALICRRAALRVLPVEPPGQGQVDEVARPGHQDHPLGVLREDVVAQLDAERSSASDALATVEQERVATEERLGALETERDGAPILAGRSSYTAWARVLSQEYERLRKRVAKGKPSVIDAYGASDPAEFFAVASEAFFEKPRQLGSKHPELYAELRNFYQVDPQTWV